MDSRLIQLNFNFEDCKLIRLYLRLIYFPICVKRLWQQVPLGIFLPVSYWDIELDTEQPPTKENCEVLHKTTSFLSHTVVAHQMWRGLSAIYWMTYILIIRCGIPLNMECKTVILVFIFIIWYYTDIIHLLSDFWYYTSIIRNQTAACSLSLYINLNHLQHCTRMNQLTKYARNPYFCSYHF